MTDTRRPSEREATPVLDPQLKAELKRLAILFLISAITLILVVADAVVRAIPHDVVPPVALLMVQVSWISGAVATYFYGLYVTIRAHAWWWVILCAIPLFGSVPGSAAYSWIRRGELERRVMADAERRGR